MWISDRWRWCWILPRLSCQPPLFNIWCWCSVGWLLTPSFSILAFWPFLALIFLSCKFIWPSLSAARVTLYIWFCALSQVPEHCSKTTVKCNTAIWWPNADEFMGTVLGNTVTVNDPVASNINWMALATFVSVVWIVAHVRIVVSTIIFDTFKFSLTIIFWGLSYGVHM